MSERLVGPGGDPGGRRRALAVPAATAAPNMQIGIYDEGETFFGDLGQVVPAVQGAARRRPPREPLLGRQARRREVRARSTASDPRDAAYDWSLYDRTAFYAGANGMKVLFSITGTPRWANGGAEPNRPPDELLADLRDFAYAAAARYSGTYIGDGRPDAPGGAPLGGVERAEQPGLPPAAVRPAGREVGDPERDRTTRRSATRSTTGVHATIFKDEQVACGVTAPAREQQPAKRPPVGLAGRLPDRGEEGGDEDASTPTRTTRTTASRPRRRRRSRRRRSSGQAPTAITLANINVLIAAVSHLYGPRRFWITEYGYQTKPPDPAVRRLVGEPGALPDAGVRDRPQEPADRPDALVPRPRRADLWPAGSPGLMTVDGRKKPAFSAFAAAAALVTGPSALAGEQLAVERVHVVDQAARPRSAGASRSRAGGAHARAELRVGGEPDEPRRRAAPTSPGSTRKPSSPSWTTSGTPPTRVATTGQPLASASIAVTGVPSFAEGSTNDVEGGEERADVLLVAGEQAVADDPELAGELLDLLAVGPVADHAQRRVDAAVAERARTRAGRRRVRFTPVMRPIQPTRKRSSRTPITRRVSARASACFGDAARRARSRAG